MKEITVKGYASEFTVVFPDERGADKFTDAMLAGIGPCSEIETRTFAGACGGTVVNVIDPVLEEALQTYVDVAGGPPPVPPALIFPTIPRKATARVRGTYAPGMGSFKSIVGK